MSHIHAHKYAQEINCTTTVITYSMRKNCFVSSTRISDLAYKHQVVCAVCERIHHKTWLAIT